jgi:hypothetical protein
MGRMLCGSRPHRMRGYAEARFNPITCAIRSDLFLHRGVGMRVGLVGAVVRIKYR